jgi:hypothetical protein
MLADQDFRRRPGGDLIVVPDAEIVETALVDRADALDLGQVSTGKTGSDRRPISPAAGAEERIMLADQDRIFTNLDQAAT